MIEFHDPRARTAVDAEPYDLRIGVGQGGALTVGLLANGFPDSEKFLRSIGAALAARHPGLEVRHYNKGNASAAASDDLIRTISAECQAAITAYGH